MSSYRNDVSHALSVMFRPSSTTKRMMNLENGFVFYYKISVLSIVLFFILSLIFTGTAAFYAGIAFVVFYWILVPLYIIVQSAIFQFVCNFALKEFKRGYDETMAASIYATMPLLLLAWLVSVPGVGPFIVVLALLWSLFVMVIALSNLQRISRLTALVAIVVTFIVEFVVAILLSVVFALGVFGSFSGIFRGLHGVI